MVAFTSVNKLVLKYNFCHFVISAEGDYDTWLQRSMIKSIVHLHVHVINVCKLDLQLWLLSFSLVSIPECLVLFGTTETRASQEIQREDNSLIGAIVSFSAFFGDCALGGCGLCFARPERAWKKKKQCKASRSRGSFCKCDLVDRECHGT